MSDEHTPVDEAENGDASVVVLFPEVKPPAVSMEGTRYDACTHRRITLTRKDRSLTCDACGAAVDAFEWLVEHAGENWKRMWQNFLVTKEAVTRMRREERALKKELKRLKSRVKYWREKDRTKNSSQPTGP